MACYKANTKIYTNAIKNIIPLVLDFQHVVAISFNTATIFFAGGLDGSQHCSMLMHNGFCTTTHIIGVLKLTECSIKHGSHLQKPTWHFSLLACYSPPPPQAMLLKDTAIKARHIPLAQLICMGKFV